MANETRYFKTPFGESGNKTEVPNVSVGGAVAYDTGYGPDYELPQGAVGRKRIERPEYNGVMNSVTGNLKQWQEKLYPTWIEDDGSGVPFSYPVGMIVSLAGVNYISLEAANQEEPGTGSKWIKKQTVNVTDASAGVNFDTAEALIDGIASDGRAIDFSELYNTSNSVILKTAIHNTISNEGGAEYILVDIDPGNLSTMMDGVWVGANHDLGGGYYAKLNTKIYWASMFGVCKYPRFCANEAQAAFDFAASFEQVMPTDQRNAKSIYFEDGVYNLQKMVRINTTGTSLIGLSDVYFDVSQWETLAGNPAAFCIGTAEQWLASGGIGSTTKYNKVESVRIGRTGGLSPIGILLSGTRNCTTINTTFEQLYCGLYGENTSELETVQLSGIGCVFTVVGDARKNRSSGSSPLGVANIDNDFSSNLFTCTTSYFSQQTGILLINAGTCGFTSTTVGLFSDNPTSNPQRFGLTNKFAGLHIWGANTNFTKGSTFTDFVFEAAGQDTSRDCILVTSQNQNNPIRGLNFNGVHVQTSARDWDNGNVTTLLKTEQYNGGNIDSITLRDSGFTPSPDGYYYGRLVDSTLPSVVGEAVRPAAISLINCYPTVAYSGGNLGASRINNIEYIEQTNMEIAPEPSGVPSGWALSSGSNAQEFGGSAGQEKYVRLTGNGGNPSFMSKTFNYRPYLSRLGSPYISLWYRGNAAPHINIIVNAQADTARVTKNGTNVARYSNALLDYDLDTNWHRAVYLFRPFAANIPFDKITVELGRIASSGTNYTEIKNIEIGFYNIPEMPYNQF